MSTEYDYCVCFVQLILTDNEIQVAVVMVIGNAVGNACILFDI